MKKFNAFYAFALLLMGTLFFSACDNMDDEEMMVDPEPQSIAEIVADDENFSDLAAALTRVNLVSTLDGDGPFTVFAPTNAAFAASGIDVAAATDEELTDILLYHVLGAKINSTDLIEGQTYASTASSAGAEGTNLTLLVERSGTSVTLNGTIMVTEADVEATNGVIHVIDDVLVPLDIVGAAVSNKEFTSLVAALQAAEGDLVTTLSGDGPFTVFAPLNSAFADIQMTVDGLDASQLASVLTYHVAAGNVRSAALTDGMMVTSVQGEDFTVNIDSDSNVTITDANGGVANVVLTDVQTTNGVIHVLDKVIIPENL